jgi:imidazolonepropionase-like amidohydrolase
VNWEKNKALTGPPLTQSPAKILSDAGVLLGLAVKSDSKVWGLAQEAWWAGKYAELTDQQAISLVSTNIEIILGIWPKAKVANSAKGQVYSGDFVIWEGDPLRGEGSVVVSVQDDGKIADCWPDTAHAVL